MEWLDRAWEVGEWLLHIAHGQNATPAPAFSSKKHSFCGTLRSRRSFRSVGIGQGWPESNWSRGKNTEGYRTPLVLTRWRNFDMLRRCHRGNGKAQRGGPEQYSSSWNQCVPFRHDCILTYCELATAVLRKLDMICCSLSIVVMRNGKGFQSRSVILLFWRIRIGFVVRRFWLNVREFSDPTTKNGETFFVSVKFRPITEREICPFLIHVGTKKVFVFSLIITFVSILMSLSMRSMIWCSAWLSVLPG